MFPKYSQFFVHLHPGSVTEWFPLPPPSIKKLWASCMPITSCDLLVRGRQFIIYNTRLAGQEVVCLKDDWLSSSAKKIKSFKKIKPSKKFETVSQEIGKFKS